MNETLKTLMERRSVRSYKAVSYTHLLGIMGKPMAQNLLKAGYELNICAINEDAVADVAAAGGVPYKTACLLYTSRCV